ncbi:MAG: phospho-N-acetylmuramoyl-pentapeptide-transferase [Saprospiraceae bacterium]
MLYELFEYLDANTSFPGAGLFRFLTFRAAMAVIVSIIVSVGIGGKVIKKLRSMQIGETVRDLGLDGQKQKEGTPTMGGIIIILAILIPALLFAKLDNVYVILMIVSTIWMGIIGFMDDYIKVFKKNKEGLSARSKVLGQIGLGILVGVTMLVSDDVVVRYDLEEAEAMGYTIVKTISLPTEDPGVVADYAYVKQAITTVPFMKSNSLDYGAIAQFLGDNADVFLWLLFIPIVIVVVTAVSNAANLTDGIDGLAAGVSAIIGMTLLAFAYVSGNALASDYLNIMYLPGTGELVVFAACLVGACLGFLWYNGYPAQVFMGDTGSLALGGIIAALAIALRKELLIPLMCGIFLVENLSVMIQVGYFKYSRKKYGEGRRVFLMAPLHHHFQRKGMHESKIVIRFWLVAIFLAVLSVVTLKIR